MNKSEFGFFFKLGAAILILVSLLVALSWALGWIGDAGVVAKDEFGPKAALTKYEWFVDQAAFIQKADADIELYTQRVSEVESRYVSTYGADKSKWLPSTQALYSHDIQTVQADLTAIKSNRNSLVRDYNAQSSKFNWAPFRGRADYPPETFVEYK